MSRKEDALEYHRRGRAGKLEVQPTKPLFTQRDLSLAYSPGVAEPCREIHADQSKVWEYTARGNLVAVVTNGTAVLGLGDIGPMAGKPVMEGKACLFKKFADIDVFDLELDASNPDLFCTIVKGLEPTFGGINLEDIKAPECFEIERRLKEELSIPVFHDDQHGTAIISGAALLNAVGLVKKDISDLRIVVSGAGAAAIACVEFYISLGASKDNVVLVDSKGIVHRDRENLTEEKRRYAIEPDGRKTLADAMKDADVFLGLSIGGIVSPEMLKSMAKDPIVFALANPDPEIDYPAAKQARPDVIMATGRSDYPNQVNNVLGFPFVFRGALDVRARQINEEMKCAAAYALAELTRESVPPSVARIYGDEGLRFGPDYLIPKPFDPRVLFWVAPAVAKAAADTGVARNPLDIEAYRETLHHRMGDAHDAIMRRLIRRARNEPKRLVFPEGHHPLVLRACETLIEERIAHPVILGNAAEIRRSAEAAGIELSDDLEIVDPETSPDASRYIDELFRMRCRKGVTHENARRAISRRIYFATMMVHTGAADGLVAGLTAEYPWTIRPALQIIGIRDGAKRAAGMHIMFHRNRVTFFGDTTVNIEPTAEELADIAIQVSDAAAELEVNPRVAMVSFSNFGSAPHKDSRRVAEAVRIVRQRRPDMNIEGEVQPDIALDSDKMQELYPFSTLSDAANVLIFPSLAAGNAAYKVLSSLGEAMAVGPILLGFRKPVAVLPRDAKVEDIVNMAAYTVTRAQAASRATLK